VVEEVEAVEVVDKVDVDKSCVMDDELDSGIGDNCSLAKPRGCF
jgi:hypothetical protein